MQYLYTFLLYLLSPFLFLRLFWRARKQPGYIKQLRERLGYFPRNLEKSIWVHAVSVGESIAALPLIEALLAAYPNYPLVVTSMTPTGALRIKAALGERVIHAYLPYDFPCAVRRFLQRIKPQVGIIMETELWPNLLARAEKQGVLLYLANARLSAKSAHQYAYIRGLTKKMLNRFTKIAAQGKEDATRFLALGAEKNKVEIIGNIKFDLTISAALIEQSKQLRLTWQDFYPVWIAASTHQGEEEIILTAHKMIQEKFPQALLILVPRHPDRFTEVAKLCKKHGFLLAKRSTNEKVTQEISIYLGDTMGELLLLYGMAEIAFIGGSLVPRGGHNLLEPAALGKALLTGPHVFNFSEIRQLLLAAEGLQQVVDATMLAQKIIYLTERPSLREKMGAQALAVVEANRGALAKQLAMIAEGMNKK